MKDWIIPLLATILIVVLIASVSSIVFKDMIKPIKKEIEVQQITIKALKEKVQKLDEVVNP